MHFWWSANLYALTHVQTIVQRYSIQIKKAKFYLRAGCEGWVEWWIMCKLGDVLPSWELCLHKLADITKLIGSPPQCSTMSCKTKQPPEKGGCLRELAGARTQDPNIKSVVLYLLSYEFIVQNGYFPILVVQM